MKTKLERSRKFEFDNCIIDIYANNYNIILFVHYLNTYISLKMVGHFITNLYFQYTFRSMIQICFFILVIEYEIENLLCTK